MSTTLDKIIEAAKALAPSDLHKLRDTVDALLASPAPS